MKSRWPTVFLDQWVWIRFAAAAKGKPRSADDLRAFEAVCRAKDAGVVFPLSATRYEETSRIRDPEQRRDLARVVAPISELRTLRWSSDLVEHQIRVALHETCGRPTFRPAPVTVLGVGAHWAFTGTSAFFKVVDDDGSVVPTVDGTWLREVAQSSEFRLFAGPADDDLPSLEKRGYVDPRVLEEAANSRLEGERAVALALESNPQDANTLQRLLYVRELWHNYRRVLARVASEYRIRLSEVLPTPPGQFTPRAAEFIERVPTPRLAAEMKYRVYRQKRVWSWNMLRDIESMSVAIPYCDVVVMDKDAAHIALQAKAPARHNTTMLSGLGQLIDVLPELESRVTADTEEPPGWSALAPRAPFITEMPRKLRPDEAPPGSQMRLLDLNGDLVDYTSPRHEGEFYG